MKRIAVLIAASAGLAAPAFAGGPTTVAPEPTVAPAPAPVYVSPSGEWTGFYSGVQLGYGSGKGDASGTRVFDGDGVVGGVIAGYRWDFGTTVFGVEGAYSASDLKDDTTGGKLKNKTDLKLQLGYDMGSSLVYATAGASWAKVDVGGASYSDNGWVAGLGYDYDLGNNWTVGGEYLYHKYDDFDASGVDADGSTISLRAAYRF